MTSSMIAMRAQFLAAITAGDRPNALQIARQACRELPTVADAYVEIVQESLYEVGRLWERSVISVAGEHTATATAQYVLAQMHSELKQEAPPAGKAVITGIEGEMHQVGANVVADYLGLHGWETRFLGTDLPGADILDVVEEHDAELLGVSVTMRSHLPDVTRLVAKARRRFGPKLRIVVGGGAIQAAPYLLDHLGVDGFGGDVRTLPKLLTSLGFSCSPQPR